MNTEVKLSASEQLLTLTREMLLSAQAGEWEKLTGLEKARLPLFDQVFSQGIAGNVELTRAVLSIDEQTKNLVHAEMPAIQDKLLKMKNSGKASTTYQSIQGFASDKK